MATTADDVSLPVGLGPILRREDERFLIGAARYVDDIEFPHALHACFVRSHHAHARLRRKEYDAAKALYEEALRRFPTALIAAEAQYYVGVSAYRASHSANDLLHAWHELEKSHPESEWTVKQNF